MSVPPEHDPTLRRIWRNSALIAAVAAAAALALRGGRPQGALGVIAGAGLMAFSYRVIRQGVDARASRALNTGHGLADDGRPRRGLAGTAWTLTKYVTRYGVIAVAAWAILVPLGASPVWLFVGVSAPVAAIVIEAVLANRPRRSS